MAIYKTARGKSLDMTALAAAHEKERAVSNVPINARGDIIDSRGKTKVPREDIKQKMYDAQELPTENRVGIKEDDQLAVAPVEDPVPSEEVLAEINRTLRVRPDGSNYFEIEWSDGSMTEESA
jgi:hypothetical protein